MNILLLLSGGTGTRLGTTIPKQYIEVEGKPIIAYSLDTFMKHGRIDRIQIVAEPEWEDTIKPWTGNVSAGFSRPGANRQLSIWNGLNDIMQYASETDRVIIHDAARPCVTTQMITDILAALEGHEGVLPAVPMKDTVYEAIDGHITSLLERDHIIAGQAPEGFVLGKYYRANEALLPDKILDIRGSTEPAVLAGMDVAYIPGDEGNYKITTQEDLRRFEQDVAKRQYE